MVAITDDLRTSVRATFRNAWSTRNGTTVPAQESIGLGNNGVRLNATVLYADLSESTAMVDRYDATFAAEVYKNYLYCAARLIRNYGGSITAYDGDRIMGVFVDDYKNTNAVRTALALNWVLEEVIRPELKAVYSSSDFVARHTVGIDTSQVLVARTGVRGDNDLVWVGRAANWAAKLTDLPNTTPLWISADVYNKMTNKVKLGANGENMWKARNWTAMNNQLVYCSTYRWQP